MFFFIIFWKFSIKLNNTKGASRVMIMIIPCGHPVRVRVSSLKKLKKVMDVISATILKINVNSDRLLMKFTRSESDEGLQRSKIIEHFINNSNERYDLPIFCRNIQNCGHYKG